VGCERVGPQTKPCLLLLRFPFGQVLGPQRSAELWNRVLQWTDSVQLYLVPSQLLLTPRKALPSCHRLCQMAISPWELSQCKEGVRERRRRKRFWRQLLEASQWLWGKVGFQSQNLSTSGLGRALEIILANLSLSGHEPVFQAGEGTCPRSYSGVVMDLHWNHRVLGVGKVFNPIWTLEQHCQRPSWRELSLLGIHWCEYMCVCSVCFLCVPVLSEDLSMPGLGEN
jgi:hypothetical protein